MFDLPVPWGDQGLLCFSFCRLVLFEKIASFKLGHYPAINYPAATCGE
jgi:hypothetical protein